MNIYALKGDPDWAAEVYASLKKGVGRFGWSYLRDEAGQPLGNADLHQLKVKIEAEGWDRLSSADQDRYQSFLLGFEKGDWVVYVNVPEWGQCTLAQVSGPYYWKVLGDDLNHCFSVDPNSVRCFDRNWDVVHPALSRRLKLLGRKWHIYAEEEFKALVSSLADDTRAAPKPTTPVTAAALLDREIEPLLEEITKRVHHTHPNYGLEALLEIVFRGIPGVRKVTRQGGAGDHGADLIVEFEGGLPFPALQSQHTCIVQAKSFEGELSDTQCVEDIRRAFKQYPAANMGLIVSTASSSTKTLDNAIQELTKSSGKRVELLIGSDVARFILRFADPILSSGVPVANDSDGATVQAGGLARAA